MQHKQLISALYEIGAIKFGQFTLKSGMISPIYLDLRLIVSFPHILKATSEIIWEQIQGIPFDLICGVPYTALPIATAISLYHQKPMVMRRKEVKEYGTKKTIEGKFQKGQSCIVIEDLITSGSSIVETIEPLEQEGIIVQHAVVLIDRDQGGKAHLKKKGYVLHAVFSLLHLLEELQMSGKIDQKTSLTVKEFIYNNQVG